MEINLPIENGFRCRFEAFTAPLQIGYFVVEELIIPCFDKIANPQK